MKPIRITSHVLGDCVRNWKPDGRWFDGLSGNYILLVDLEFKNTPREKAYRAFKATFRRARQLKAQPDSADAGGKLKDDFEQLDDGLKKSFLRSLPKC